MSSIWGSATFYWFDFESSSGVQIPDKKDPSKYDWLVDPQKDKPITFQYMNFDSVLAEPIVLKFYPEASAVEKYNLELIADFFFSNRNKWVVPVNDNIWYDLTLFESRCKVYGIVPELIHPNKKPFIDLKDTLVLLNKAGSMSGFRSFTKNAGKPQKKVLPQELYLRKDYLGIEKEIALEAEWIKKVWFSLQSKKFCIENVLKV